MGLRTLRSTFETLTQPRRTTTPRLVRCEPIPIQRRILQSASNLFVLVGLTGSRLTYAGDNFVRYTGGVKDMAKKQMFAWQAAERGADVSMQADPTKLELMHKQFEVKKEQFTTKQRESILAKVGLDGSLMHQLTSHNSMVVKSTYKPPHGIC